MTYNDFISKLRAEVKDHKKPMHNDFTGDGATTLFVVTDIPVIEESYIVKVDGVQKTEGISNDYVIDRESGVITFTSPPGNGLDVTIDFKFANLSDSTWLSIINEIIDDMEGEFFIEEVDEDFDTTEKDDVSYSCPTNCLDVVNFFYKTIDNPSTRWTMVSEYTNWRYSRDENKIYLGTGFSITGYPLKLHFLKGFILGDSFSSTLDIPTNYIGVLRRGCLWRYYDHRLADKVNITTKVANERTITPLQNIQALSSHYYKLYLKEKGRKKPTKPVRLISNFKQGAGIP